MKRMIQKLKLDIEKKQQIIHIHKNILLERPTMKSYYRCRRSKKKAWQVRKMQSLKLNN